MDKFIDIPEGRLNDFLVHGFFVMIAGGVLLLVHWSITLIAIALAVALFRFSSGIQIDPVGKRIRVYKSLGTLRFGDWRSVDGYNAITIRYTNETQQMGGRGPELTVRVRTYDLYVIGRNGDTWLFHEFTEYAKARRSAESMAGLWLMQLNDEIQERRQQAHVNAPNRRR